MRTSSNNGHSHEWTEGKANTSVDNGHNHRIIYDKDGKAIGIELVNFHTHSLT